MTSDLHKIYIGIHIHSKVHTHAKLTHIHAYIHVHTHIHAYIHVHTHTRLWLIGTHQVRHVNREVSPTGIICYLCRRKAA